MSAHVWASGPTTTSRGRESAQLDLVYARARSAEPISAQVVDEVSRQNDREGLRAVSVTDEPALPTGEVIGQRCGGSYVITSVLGVGGMGAVYLATNEMLAGKSAAVKVLLPELTRRSEGLARFRAEVYAAGKIDDPNIVKVFDAGELDGRRLYMLMEFCAHGSLAGLLEKRGPLPLDLILTIACPIGSALHTAHFQGRCARRRSNDAISST
jgi:serine/threonine protein kinase